jgi:hypothetical protein
MKKSSIPFPKQQGDSQVLQERTLGPKSFFRHYISNLPIGVPGIPLFYSQEAIQALEEYPPLRCSDCLC